MERWTFSHRIVGVNAPSWLTFEVHRPYFDGATSRLVTVHARGVGVAAQRFQQCDVTGLRFGMTMPPSFRQLLTEESRLRAYRVADPTELPDELASNQWRTMTQAFEARDDLDLIDRAGLASWLNAVCLPAAILEVLPNDYDASACEDPVIAAAQYLRATALFASDAFSAPTIAAYRPLVEAPAATVAHAQAVAAWGYLLARHARDESSAPLYFQRAGELLKSLEPTVPPFDHLILQARLLLREAMYQERRRNLGGAWSGLNAAADLVTAAESEVVSDLDGQIATEMRRRLIDRQVDIAARRDDRDAEEQAICAGIALDPWCVKIRMQDAQAAERRNDYEKALAGYLLASRLGPYGTAFALLGAVRCARTLGKVEFARVLAERAFRSAPRSEQTKDMLAEMCAEVNDEPLAGVVRRTAGHHSERHYAGNWHYQMYASYLNLGESCSPCLYARLPSWAFEFAESGEAPAVMWQRLMPPAFRSNLVRESGLSEFAVTHPADLPERLRTSAWWRLCEWLINFDDADLREQYLTAMVLFELGFGRLVLELIEQRPAQQLTSPDELRLHHARDIVRYVTSVGAKVIEPQVSFDIANRPDCPLQLRFLIASFAVVFHARETKSVPEVIAWREKAQRDLDKILASDDYSVFEKIMHESRFLRAVSFAPFMLGDRRQLESEMARAEELARAVPAITPYEEFLKRENLRACLESRSKEAFAFGEVDTGKRRVVEVIDIDPYEPKSHLELAETLCRAGRDAEAADRCLRAARLGPHSTALGYALAGERFEKAGQPVLAEDCFIQALRIDPYAVSAARGWRRVAASDGLATLATEYADGLEAWGATRLAARSTRSAR